MVLDQFPARGKLYTTYSMYVDGAACPEPIQKKLTVCTKTVAQKDDDGVFPWKQVINADRPKLE